MMRKAQYAMLYLSRFLVMSFIILFIGAVWVESRGQGPQPMVMLGVLAVAVVVPWRILKRPPSRGRSLPADVIPENGHDFEHWVAERLRQQGWRTRVTQGSGDQGIDVIAVRSGKQVGIQCKRYIGSVGNKAVQEAFSGKAYHRVDIAAVMTTGRYTQSARDLARRTGVHLLEVGDIPTMHRKLSL